MTKRYFAREGWVILRLTKQDEKVGSILLPETINTKKSLSGAVINVNVKGVDDPLLLNDIVVVSSDAKITLLTEDIIAVKYEDIAAVVE